MILLQLNYTKKHNNWNVCPFKYSKEFARFVHGKNVVISLLYKVYYNKKCVFNVIFIMITSYGTPCI